MRWLSISALLVAGACNALLGLESTVGDRDGDGIADEVDNCPDDSNPDQLDTDGNGIGDACAPCVAARGIDLDEDGIDDGCDTCIGPGPIGMDSDGDGLDDGCDPCFGGTGVTGETENIGGVGTLGRDEHPKDGLDDGCTVCFHATGIDVDGDGLDDACDSCLAGPPHDEDGDGLDDGCDNCPGDPNPDQANFEPMIGVVCDAEEQSSRGLFDPFLVELDLWEPSPGFSVANDRLHADSAGGGPISRTALPLMRGQFRIAMGIAAKEGTVGFRLKNDIGTVDVSCSLGDDGFVRVAVAGDSTMSPNKISIDDGPIQLVAGAKIGFAGNTIICDAISAKDDARTSVVTGFAGEPYSLSIEVDGTA